MLDWQSEIISKLSPDIVNASVVTMSFDGMMKGTDYFIKVDGFGTTHPLYEYMQRNQYLKTLSQSKPFVLHSSGAGDKKTLSALKDTSAIDVTKFQKQAFTYGNISDHLTLANRPEFELHTGDPGKLDLTISDAGCNMFFDVTYFSYNLSFYSSEGNPKFGVDVKDSWELMCGYPTDADANPLAPYFKMGLSMVGALGADAATDLGVKVAYRKWNSYHWNQNIGINLPMLIGYRRWFLAEPTSGGFVLMAGYLVGEGEDYFWTKFGTYYQGSTGSASGTSGKYFAVMDRAVRRLPSKNVTNSFVLEGEKFDLLWPLSWNSLLVDKIHISESLVTETEPTVVGERVLTEISLNLKVDRVDGSLLYEDYEQFLLSGYDVFEPYSVDEVADVRKSWSKLPAGVTFAVATEKCNGRSVKETWAYKEYGKKRAKACKDNDFLDKRYNDEYTWKQIDNKLGALGSLSVWVVDSSLASLSDDVSSSRETITRTITIKERDSNSVTYSDSSSALSGTLVLSEENFSAFLDKVMPCMFTSSSNTFSNFLSANGLPSVAEMNAESEAKTYGNISLGMGTRMVGSSTTYSEVLKVNGVDGQIAFLASQVSDYRNFVTTLPKMIRMLQGDNVYPQLAAEFTTLEV